MKNKRYSLKDIASSLNVSVTTVSFVLSGKAKEKKISDGVTRKILDYAKKIDYKPNEIARSLRTGRSKIIACMVEDISNSFFAKIARIIEDMAYDQGYRVLFCSNENKDDKAIELISLFNERQVDGYIITPTSGIQNTIKSLMGANVPVVLFDRYFPDIETSYVIVDNEDSAYNATKHLINNGYENISLVTTDVKQTSIFGRNKGYEKAIQEYNLKEYILSVPYKEKTSRRKKELIKNYFSRNPRLDAVLFATNYLTEAGLEVLKNHFPQLIHEWGIITFDDNVYFQIHSPSISAVSQPLREMAEELMSIVLNDLQNGGDTRPLKKVVFRTTLQARDSSIAKEYKPKQY